jgi:predicted HD superfamily hydrolase involved in NAD metabolism
MRRDRPPTARRQETRDCARLVREHLGRRRAGHCRRTAALAYRLAGRFGLDRGRARLAGLAHDLARELPEAELLRLAAGDGAPLRPWETERPVLLHGRAAVVLLGPAFDGEVREAVADHVTGRSGMSALARLVYVADFLEPGRGFLKPAERRRVLGLGLDGQVAWVAERVFEYLRGEGLAIAPPALALSEELKSHAATQAQVG